LKHVAGCPSPTRRETAVPLRAKMPSIPASLASPTVPTTPWNTSSRAVFSAGGPRRRNRRPSNGSPKLTTGVRPPPERRRKVGQVRVVHERVERDVATGVHRGASEELLDLSAARGALSLARHLHRGPGRRLPGSDDGLARRSAGDPAAERDPSVPGGGGPAREARPCEHASPRGGVTDRDDLRLGGGRRARGPGGEERDE